MSKGAGRAKIPILVALGGLVAAGAALLLRNGQGAPPEPPAARPVTVDQAFVPERPRSPTPPPPAPPAAPTPAGAGVETTRRVIDPAQVFNEPGEPLTPPEIRVDVEVDPRGAMTAEPLIPPVLQADVEVDPRGAMTAEPLTPPVLENPAEPARR
ncbi:hypothetical protein [Polyangium spumosum]|uniref:Uncharacterized protein n=1 Tax=Polyangium spumosum TaxID=889282 RepID=A0A6N7PTT8_9BACT|nr:hypothetical protein [Polyangium spumosum]MRG95403.1 hypothetical protein [Polyangium spumosum]